MHCQRVVMAWLLTLCVCIQVVGRDNDMSVSAKDSTDIALATVWASYLRPYLVRDYGDDSVTIDRYIDGMKKSLTLDKSREPYYRGVLEGFQLGRRVAQMRQLGLSIDSIALIDNISSQLRGRESPFSPEQADRYLSAMIASRQPVDTLSRVEQQEWLDRQFKREGVVKTQDGLLFETLKQGEGVYPTMSDRVKILYTARLSDGTVFDSTDEPVTFDVEHLVPGFTEGLLMMKPGGRYRLFIPASLGYGENGISGAIPGNAALDFTVDLLEVIPSAE